MIWEYLDEPILPERLEDLRRLSAALSERGHSLRRDLEALLSPAEIDATGARTEELVASGTFPEPGIERPYPWPPI